MSKTQTINDGIRIYSSPFLKIYDALVMGPIVNHVWRCHSENLVYFYNENVSNDHGDIGVGTGYCLDNCQFPSLSPNIALIDLRQSCLNHTSKRIAHYQPETHLRDASKPIHIPGRKFNTVALGGILHCLPGDMSEKAKVFDHIEDICHKNTGIFGYTLVNSGVTNTFLSSTTAKLFRLLRVINNQHDSPAWLKAELEYRFEKVEVTAIGNMAFFKASRRKPTSA